MKNKLLIVFLISNLVFIACNSKVKNENEKIEELTKNLTEKINSPDKLSEIWQSLPLRQLPIIDSTSFDNIKVNKEFNTEQLKSLQIDGIYPNFYEEKSLFKISPSYKINLSKEFYTIVINVFKGDHELETVLINYDISNENLIDFKIIAYDEIAEGWSRKRSEIDKISITISDEFYLEETKIETSKFHINRNGELNPIKMEFTSDLRPKINILLNRVYVDTIQFSSYNDDADYKLLLGKKKGKSVALVYNWEWYNNEKLNFNHNDFIKVTWKMDSIFIAGDGETLDFKERAIDAEIVKLNETQKYIVALKNFLIREWKLVQKSNSDIKNIRFENNILTIEGNENFVLSSYDFNDIKIIKSKQTKKINITIYNVGGGAGGNVLVSETYILTTLDSINFDIKRGMTKLIK